MIRGFYTAGSGLISQQTAIDNAANNMANINTTGYKKQDVSFSELLYSNLATPDGTQPQNLKVGNGTRVSQANAVFTPGSTQFTGKTLDFALTSDGFFGVMAQDGTIKYTRDGSFGVSTENTGNYLVTANGDYVVDKNGSKIRSDDENFMQQIGVFDFSNPYGLENVGNNVYQRTTTSGDPLAIEGNLRNGFLELSNVDLSSEMTDLITIQRSYQFNAKLVETADELENITNNLR